MSTIDMYCKGSCDGNPGPGGWGVILVIENQDKPVKLRCGYRSTTNNRMEMMAVIAGLTYFPPQSRHDITLHTHLELLEREFRDKWADIKWPHNGWRKTDGNTVENIDLWSWITKLRKPHNLQVVFHKESQELQLHNAHSLASTVERKNIDLCHEDSDLFLHKAFPPIYDLAVTHDGLITDIKSLKSKGFCFGWSATTGSVFIHCTQIPVQFLKTLSEGASIRFQVETSRKQLPNAIKVEVL